MIVSGTDDASAPQLAIAPNGRAAVVYDAYTSRGGETRVAIGPSPDRIGPARTLPGALASSGDVSPRLLARSDGGFVLCNSGHRYRRRNLDVCAIAPPNGDFGEPRVIRSLPAGAEGGFSAVVRPDSSVVFLLTRTTQHADGTSIHTDSAVATMNAAGEVGPEQPFPREQSEIPYSSGTDLAVADDGTVATSALVSGAGPGSRPGIRLMPPGSLAFGPVIPVSPDPFDYRMTITGGRQLIVQFVKAGTALGTRRVNEIVPVNPAASVVPPLVPAIAPPLTLPGTKVGYGAVAPLPGGGLFAATSTTRTEPGDSDCYNPVAGTVATGPLPPLGSRGAATRLSTRGQIALYPQVVALDDGTVITQWLDAADFDGSARVEAAVRAPGAALPARPQSLAPFALLSGATALAAAGNHAAVVWETVGGPDRPGHVVVSTLRDAAPYAPQARLPKDPEAPCDE